MLKKICALGLLLTGLAIMAAEPEPVYFWNFERDGFLTHNGQEVAPGSKDRWISANYVVDGGFGGGSALQCEPDQYRRQIANMQLAWPVFTMECRFKNTQEFSTQKSTCLIYYMSHSWRRRYLELAVSEDGKVSLEVVRRTDDAKTVLKTFRLEGDAYDFRPNVWYTIRFSLAAGGKCSIWIDSVLYQEADSLATLQDLAGEYPEAYPLLIFGTALPGDQNIRRFNGLIDDVRIWDQVVPPPVWEVGRVESVAPASTNAAVSVTDPNLLMKNSVAAPVLDGNLDEPFWADVEWSVPFTVMEKAAAALGAFEKVDDKFVQHAAKTALASDGKHLFLAVNCPVPEGVDYKLTATKDGDNIWADDCIEFFVRPNVEAPLFFQYLVNADGWKQVLRHRDVGLHETFADSQAQARAQRSPTGFNIELAIPLTELGLADLATASITFNVTRCGPTADGLSTWAPVGQIFANPSRFGKLLTQPRSDYWANQIAAVESDLARLEVDPSLKLTVSPQVDAIRQQVAQIGDDATRWDEISAGVQNLRNSLTRIALLGKPFLLWSGSPWGNTSPQMPVPMTAKPLETVKLRMARNGKAIYGFAFSNLSDKAMMPRIKLLPDPLPTNLNYYDRLPEANTDAGVLMPNVTFKEGLPLQDQAAQTIPDPLAQLILNSVFRCQPGHTVPLWMEIDTHGLNAGVYRAFVHVRPTYQNVPAQQFRLELEIVDLDLDEAQTESFNYCYIENPAIYNLYREYGFTYLYCGTPGQRSLDIYPQFDADGNVIQDADFTRLDAQIDKALAAGMDQNRLKLFFFLGFDYTYWRKLMHKGKVQLAFDTPAWHKGFGAWMAQLKKHLWEKYQITMDRVVFNPEDESDGLPDEQDSPMNIALASVKAIKQIDPEARTMLNPFFGKKNSGELEYLFKRLAEHTDIIEFYRPHLDAQPELLELARAAGDFEFWTYHILMKSSAPLQYRRLYWQNWNNDFTAVCAYWHFDSHAGGDGFNSFDGGKNTADYGVIYSDVPSDLNLSSRRSEAWYQGHIDFKLGVLCQNYLQQAQAKGLDVQAEQAKLLEIKQQGLKADLTQLDALRQEMIDLALALKAKID